MKLFTSPQLPVLASSTSVSNPDSTHGLLFFRGNTLYQRTSDGVEAPVADAGSGSGVSEFVSAASTTTMSFTNGIFTKIPLSFDSSVPKAGNIQVANGAILVNVTGYYQVVGSYHFTGPATGRRALGFDVTPNPNEAWSTTDNVSATYSIYSGAVNTGVSHADIRYVEAGNYIRLIGYQDSGSTLSVSPPAGSLNVLRAALIASAASEDLTISPLAAWPVGSIFMNVTSTNPAILLGGGTWQAWGQGRVPVSVDTSQPNFSTPERIGGTNNHVHGMDSAGAAVYDGGAVYTLTNSIGQAWTSSRAFTATGGGSVASSVAIGNGGTSKILGTTDEETTLQPYITCYMWKRTA